MAACHESPMRTNHALTAWRALKAWSLGKRPGCTAHLEFSRMLRRRRIMSVFAQVCCAFILFTCAGWSQDSDLDDHPFPIGEINYFGYGGLPLAEIRAALPLHVGDTLSLATFSTKPVDDAIASVIGKPATDVSVVCCDASRRLELFIGLPGSTSRTLDGDPAPSGNTHLDPEGLGLYEQGQLLLVQVVARGTATEDDSQGYRVSKDPALKKVDLAMRSYAIGREPGLTHVLQTAGDPKDRRAAATLMGYVRRSPTQLEALSKAIHDPDGEVRNNAIRALEVLAADASAEQMQISLTPFISLLYSGSWTDRNKASLFLMRMTESRNPELLRSLRDQALEPLIEGASWDDVPGHSDPFLRILARIGGIPNDKIETLRNANNKDTIIAAAMRARDEARH